MNYDARQQYKNEIAEAAAKPTSELIDIISDDAGDEVYAAHELIRRFRKDPAAAHRADIAPVDVCDKYDLPPGSTWFTVASRIVADNPKPRWMTGLCSECGAYIGVPVVSETALDRQLGSKEDREALQKTVAAMFVEADRGLSPKQADAYVESQFDAAQMCQFCAFNAGADAAIELEVKNRSLEQHALVDMPVTIN